MRALLRALLLLSILPGLPLTAGAGAPVKLIIDTDFDSDVDDVAALSLAHAYADCGKAEILGVAVVGLNETSAGAVHAQNNFYGRPEIPVAVRRGHGPPSSSSYTGMMIANFPAPFDRAKAPDPVPFYRALLAKAEDRSVVLVSLGHLTNVADLLDSPGDAISPLTGVELAEKKVIRYVCMGSEYPKQLKPGTWGNFLPDPAAVIKVNDRWPTPLIYTGGGAFSRLIKTGRPFLALPEGSLVRQAYEIFFARTSWAKGPDHHSADLIAIHIAVEGVAPWFRETRGGYCHVFENGTIEWRNDRDDANRSYVADLAEGIQGDAVARFYHDLIIAAEMKRLGKK